MSEPRFSTPCQMRFFPREKEETVFVEGFFLRKAVFPFSRGKNRISQGVENRGSLISVPLALRVYMYYASWGPIFWPFFRRSARAPTTKIVREIVAIKRVFDNWMGIKRAVRSPYGGVRSTYSATGSPYGKIRSPCGPLLVNYWIVGRGPGALNCRGSGRP